MLTLNNVTTQYKNKIILKDISMELENSEIIGLVAPNGTGKTTLLRTISGLIKPVSGSISIDDITLSKNRIDYYKKIYFVESNSTLYPNLKGIDHLNYVKSAWNSSIDIKTIIKALDLTSYIEVPIKKLSLGMKQHILLAMCIVSNANYILLDEPMNGLDPSSIKTISSYLKQMKIEGKTIILSSHILTNIDNITDRVIFLKDKTIIHSLDMKKDKTSSEVIYDKLYGQDGLYETTNGF